MGRRLEEERSLLDRFPAGTLDRISLDALMYNCMRFGWGSLKDEGLIHTFLPRVKIVRKDLTNDPRTYERILDGVMTLPAVITGYTPKAEIDSNSATKIQLAILLYERNKARIAQGLVVPEKDLRWTYHTIGRVVALKEEGLLPNYTRYVPIPDVTSQLVISSIIGYDDKTTPRSLTKEQRQHVRDNLDVLKVCFGFNPPKSLLDRFL